jgi:hypothetical protein
MNWLQKICNLNSDTPTEQYDHYVSIGHTLGDKIVLYACNGNKLITKTIDNFEAKSGQSHSSWDGFIEDDYLLAGRVDLTRKEGSMSVVDVDYKNRSIIKKAINLVMQKFSDIKFFVFYDSKKMSTFDFFNEYL